MTRSKSPTRSTASRHRALYCAAALAAAAVLSACQSGGSGGGADSRGVVVVNAPVAGEVRRVIAREGMSVESGAPIIEIAVQVEVPAATPTPGESAESRAAREIKSADAEIEAARAEAVRHEAEVSRLTPLVANGEASAAQLEGERALFERAQQRRQRAQDAKRSAEAGLNLARQPGQNQSGAAAAPPTQPREQIVAATASSAGTVSVVSVRAGDRVKAGQPVATLRANQ